MKSLYSSIMQIEQDLQYESILDDDFVGNAEHLMKKRKALFKRIAREVVNTWSPYMPSLKESGSSICHSRQGTSAWESPSGEHIWTYGYTRNIDSTSDIVDAYKVAIDFTHKIESMYGKENIDIYKDFSGSDDYTIIILFTDFTGGPNHDGAYINDDPPRGTKRPRSRYTDCPEMYIKAEYDVLEIGVPDFIIP